MSRNSQKMSSGGSSDKVIFRAEWLFDSDSDAGIAIEYINSLDQDKRTKVVQLLQASFYPEAVYENYEVDSDRQRRIRTSIYWLQQRLGYLQKLEADILGKDLKTSVEVERNLVVESRADRDYDPRRRHRSTAQTSAEYIHSQSSQAGYAPEPPANPGSGSSDPAGVSDDWDDEQEDEDETYNSFYDDDL